MASSWDKRHNDEGDGYLWVRPATSWNKKTKIRNQKSGQREEDDDERDGKSFKSILNPLLDELIRLEMLENKSEKEWRPLADGLIGLEMGSKSSAHHLKTHQDKREETFSGFEVPAWLVSLGNSNVFDLRHPVNRLPLSIKENDRAHWNPRKGKSSPVHDQQTNNKSLSLLQYNNITIPRLTI